jgi:hypothetical protein
MSRSRHRNLDRRISQPLVEREFRARISRHGKPVTRRVRKIVTDPVTNMVKVTFEQVLVREPTIRKVARGSTGTHGRENKPEGMAPRGAKVSK